jgi:tripartite-type tricarboxylate transporter receptor subunit TctC
MRGRTISVASSSPRRRAIRLARGRAVPKPVKAIVPYTPGSSADLIARNLGPRLSEGWKVPFVVDYRAGASGIIGVQAAMATLVPKGAGVAEIMAKQGLTPAGETPEELHDVIRSDYERWHKIVREANIKAE